MSWSSVIASLKRHLAAIEKGEDYDEETGLLHSAHVQWNAHALTAYYKLYPQGDDRQHEYLNKAKIGLDIDEVLCDFLGGWVEKFNMSIPNSWYFDYKIKDRFEEMKKNNSLDKFYLDLKVKYTSDELGFEPSAYITSRPVTSKVTMKWLEDNGYPLVEVYTVNPGESKVEAVIKSGVDIFIDDNYYNFIDLNKNGICCLLLTTKHNEKFNVGFKRIKDFKDFKERFL